MPMAVAIENGSFHKAELTSIDKRGEWVASLLACQPALSGYPSDAGAKRIIKGKVRPKH